MFQSTTAESNGHSGNRDPEPWECFVCGMRFHSEPILHGSGSVYDPRPEFDRPPVSGILAGLRDDMAGSSDLGGNVRSHAEFWLSSRDDWDATEAEIAHAHRVLSLLVAVSG